MSLWCTITTELCRSMYWSTRPALLQTHTWHLLVMWLLISLARQLGWWQEANIYFTPRAQSYQLHESYQLHDAARLREKSPERNTSKYMLWILGLQIVCIMFRMRPSPLHNLYMYIICCTLTWIGRDITNIRITISSDISKFFFLNFNKTKYTKFQKLFS